MELIKRANKHIDMCKGIFILTLFTITLKYYVFLVFNTNLKIGTPKPLSLIMNAIYLICLFGILLYLKSDIKDKLLIGIGLIITILSRDENIMIFFLLAIYAKNNNISVREIVIYYTTINLMMFLGILVLYMTGILGNGVYTHYRNGVARIDFGFGNPNVPFLCLLPILSGYIYLKYDKYSILDRIIIVAVVMYIYFNTYSRTGLLATIMTLVFIEILRFIGSERIKTNKIIKFLLSNIFSILLLFSIFVALYLNSWEYNVLLSSRPEYWNYYLKEITFFGINKSTELIYPLDNTYIYLFKMYGIMAGIFIIYLITKSTSKVLKEGNIMLYSLVAMYCIYGFGENVFFNKSLSPIFIILVIYFIDDFKHYVELLKNKSKRWKNER